MARNKFGARKVVIDGHTFDSGWEYRRWLELQLLERAGEISELTHPVKRFKLCDDYVTPRTGRKVSAPTYRPDYSYVEDGQVVYEDAKGFKSVKTRAGKTKSNAAHAQANAKRKIVESRYGITVWFVYEDERKD